MGTIAKVTAGGSTHLIASTCYGTCGTAAGTAAKVATIQDSQAFTLLTGVTVHIKFTYSNTVASPTLNVNSTGAKAIKAYGTTASGTSTTASWYAGSIVSFTYDGTNWIQNDYKSSADRVAKSGDTMTGNLTMRMDSERTESADPDTPAQISLQTRWTDQTITTPSQKTSTSYIRAYSDHAGNGNNIVISPGGNVFIGGGEAPQNHYALYKNSGEEKTYLTGDNDIHIQANGNTIANRKGLLINTSHELLPEVADVAKNNVGSIGNSTKKWASGYFVRIQTENINAENITGTQIAVSSYIQAGDVSYISGGKIKLQGTMIKRDTGSNDFDIIDANTPQGLVIASSAEADYKLFLGVDQPGTSSAMWGLAPNSFGKLNCGTAGRKWDTVYARTGTINTSDRNEKENIEELNENAKDLIMSLKPVSYKFIDGTSGRTHYGMIAQDIEEELENLNMTGMDFAGFCKDQKTESYEEDGEIKYRDIEGEYTYGLRYEEFIAPLIKTVQMQQQEIEELKKRIDILEKSV